MKTEQEQIEQMINILKNNNEVCHYISCIKCKYHDNEDCHYTSSAYALYQAGYGDVSEYKAEIERLKADNEALTMWNEAYTEENEKLKEENKKLEEDIDMIIKEQKDDCKFDIKQAKIDTLSKAKEKLNSAPNGWAYTGYIDDLIEEVENENARTL